MADAPERVDGPSEHVKDKAALGPDSYKPGGAVAGLTLDALKASWLKPFEPEAEGGCPSEPEALPWFARKEALEGARVGQGLVKE